MPCKLPIDTIIMLMILKFIRVKRAVRQTVFRVFILNKIIIFIGCISLVIRFWRQTYLILVWYREKVSIGRNLRSVRLFKGRVRLDFKFKLMIVKIWLYWLSSQWSWDTSFRNSSKLHAAKWCLKLWSHILLVNAIIWTGKRTVNWANGASTNFVIIAWILIWKNRPLLV